MGGSEVERDKGVGEKEEKPDGIYLWGQWWPLSRKPSTWRQKFEGPVQTERLTSPHVCEKNVLHWSRNNWRYGREIRFDFESEMFAEY